MQQFPVLKAFNLAAAPVDIGDCFNFQRPVNQTPSFTSTVRVGFTTESGHTPGGSSREINIAEYNLYRWLLDHGADDGETVLVCWTSLGD